MIKFIARPDGFALLDTSHSMRTRHISQIEFWGLLQNEERNWHFSGDNTFITLQKIMQYLHAQKLDCEMDNELASGLATIEQEQSSLSISLQAGLAIKNGDLYRENKDFLLFVRSRLPRELKHHQIKAALHLLSVENGANFSVPGSGKTTVVLSVYAWLRKLGEITNLFVVGPPSCFKPWKDEFEATIGYKPSCEILAGGNVEERRLKYYSQDSKLADLYLTTFQTLQRDKDKVRHLMERANMSFFLVVDEAHYIKQQGGSWSQAILDISDFACRRCVLTGTPFPHSYIDAINIFKALYPVVSPLDNEKQAQLINLVEQKQHEKAAKLLDKTIGPLFYRVRKSDLNLAKPEFPKPIIVKMGAVERLLYDAIIDRIKEQSQGDNFRDIQTVQRLQRGRIIRLRQAVSYAKLLASAIDGYDEILIRRGSDLVSKIIGYDSLESPGKITALLGKIEELKKSEGKILVWSNFIGSLYLIQKSCSAKGWSPKVICGNTPTENKYNQDILTREKIIEQFNDKGSGLDILIANPAACSESVSLHKACSHAIYYDLSYNCAQYLQSLDRIHRVGGSENKPSYYYFLQYGDTFENDILENILQKSRNMSRIIDQEFPLCEMEIPDEEIDAYERIFSQ